MASQSGKRLKLQLISAALIYLIICAVASEELNATPSLSASTITQREATAGVIEVLMPNASPEKV